MKANILSLSFKIVGAAILILALTLKGFKIWDIRMQDVIICVMTLQALVTPIDISKIKESGHDK